MKYLKSFLETKINKEIYAEGGDCFLYPFLKDNNKIIKYFDDYPEMMNHHAEMFQKRPDIFPILYKQGKKYLLLEKLNDKKALLDIDNMLNYYINKYNLINIKNYWPEYIKNEPHSMTTYCMRDIFNNKFGKIEIDKYKDLYERIDYIIKEITPYYKEIEPYHPDIHPYNFGYSKDGILKFLDV
jgi:hypothetical protein